MSPRPFLTARWVDLGIVTYAVDPSLVAPFMPPGLEPDVWPAFAGQALVSLVAFDFLDTRVKGIRIPGHVNFPEVNLRFYVRDPRTSDQGVCFIRELVPRHAIAWVAKRIYNEPYQVATMRSRVEEVGEIRRIEHHFTVRGCQSSLIVSGSATRRIPPEGDLARFLTQKLFGFGRDHKGRTLRYRVDHPVWELHDRAVADVNVDFARVYGSAWRILNDARPVSVVLAKGSEVRVDPHRPN